MVPLTGDYLVSVTVDASNGQVLDQPDLFVARLQSPCRTAAVGTASAALVYPGPFTLVPADSVSPAASDSDSADAVLGISETPQSTSAPLAITGASTPVLATLSTLLLTMGGVLMVASRREDEHRW